MQTLPSQQQAKNAATPASETKRKPNAATPWANGPTTNRRRPSTAATQTQQRQTNVKPTNQSQHCQRKTNANEWANERTDERTNE